MTRHNQASRDLALQALADLPPDTAAQIVEQWLTGAGVSDKWLSLLSRTVTAKQMERL